MIDLLDANELRRHAELCARRAEQIIAQRAERVLRPGFETPG